MAQDPPTKPEEQELETKRAELAAVEAELAERESELADVQADLVEFEQRSQAELDPRYVELANLNQRIGELLSRMETEEAPAPEAREEDLKNERPPRKREPRASVPPTPKRAPVDLKEDTAATDADHLKRLYRDVAKLVHPDLAEDDAERHHRHALMIRANEAYDAGDETKLSAIMHEWESSPEAIRGEGPVPELIRTIRKIYRGKLRLAIIATEMDRLAGTSLYNLMSMADAAEDYERDLLAEMAGRLDQDIEQAKKRLAELERMAPLEETAAEESLETASRNRTEKP